MFLVLLTATRWPQVDLCYSNYCYVTMFLDFLIKHADDKVHKKWRDLELTNNYIVTGKENEAANAKTWTGFMSIIYCLGHDIY